MANDPKQKTDQSQPMIYQIRVKGHVDEQWTDWFGGLTITLEESGDMLFSGPVPDQAALFGLLRRVRDLGMQLISVTRLDSGKIDQPAYLDNRQNLQKRRKSNENAECDS